MEVVFIAKKKLCIILALSIDYYAYSLQIYSFSLKWMLLNKDWVDLQAISLVELCQFCA